MKKGILIALAFVATTNFITVANADEQNLTAREKQILADGYDRFAYQNRLKNLSDEELSSEKMGPYLKSKTSCIGVAVADVVVGALESIPIVNLMVKGVATSASETSRIAEIYDCEYDRFNACEHTKAAGVFFGIANIPLQGFFHGIGWVSTKAVGDQNAALYNESAIKNAPSATYAGTRLAHDGMSRAFGCRQAILKLEDINNEINSRH